MSPLVRLASQVLRQRSDLAPPLLGTPASRHPGWLWDLDVRNEPNEGPTLYDLGRTSWSTRVGFVHAPRERR